jgi:hypothetical protein
MEKKRGISGIGLVFRFGESEGFPESEVFRFWQETVGGAGCGSQPADEADQIWFTHHGTAEAWAVETAAEVEENCAACVGGWGIGVVADFDEPAVGGVCEAHPLFLEPVGFRSSGWEPHMAVVFWKAWVVHPGVPFGDADKGIIGLGWKGGISGVNGAKKENAGGCAPILFNFSAPALILAEEAVAPGESIFSEQNGNQRAGGLPSRGGAFKALE